MRRFGVGIEDHQITRYPVWLRAWMLVLSVIIVLQMWHRHEPVGGIAALAFALFLTVGALFGGRFWPWLRRHRGVNGGLSVGLMFICGLLLAAFDTRWSTGDCLVAGGVLACLYLMKHALHLTRARRVR
jgi:hypothetical protein